jgi:hypothetical protein
MRPFFPLLTSNSTWLSASNLIWCLLVAVTPVAELYPKMAVWLLVATNIAFVIVKYFQGKLPEPTPTKPTK